VFAGAVLGSLFWATRGLGLTGEAAVTLSFLTLAFGQLWHVFNMRQLESGVFSNEVTRNRYVWAAVGFCVVLLLGVVHIPGVASVLEVQPPSAEGWGIVALMSLVPLGVGQIVLLIRRHLGTANQDRLLQRRSG
jgi:Ca2+-transporting ATPase